MTSPAENGTDVTKNRPRSSVGAQAPRRHPLCGIRAGNHGTIVPEFIFELCNIPLAPTQALAASAVATTVVVRKKAKNRSENF